MLGHFEQVLFVVVMLMLLAIVMSGVSWRDQLARGRAWLNRRRHPELAKLFNTADFEGKFVIAQEMMTADREKQRRRGDSLGSHYPIVWDYYIPPGRNGYRTSVMRRTARVKDHEVSDNR